MVVADAVVLMGKLAMAAPTIRKIGGIATDPLLAATGLHQRCRLIAAKTAMFPRNGLGLHPIIGHRPLLSDNRSAGV